MPWAASGAAPQGETQPDANKAAANEANRRRKRLRLKGVIPLQSADRERRPGATA